MAYELGANGFFKSVNGVPVTKRELPATCRYTGWTSVGPQGIMLHGTAGCSSDIFGVLNARGISAHFNVDRQGNIYQYVSLNHRAAHAYDANHTFFGIEHTGQHPSCKGYTRVQRDASAKLSAALREWTTRKWDTDIPLRHIAGCPLSSGFKEHRDGAVPKHCYWNPGVHVDAPGSHWGWDEYLSRVKAVEVTPRVRYVVDGKTFNSIIRATRYLRRTLKDDEVGDSHTIRVKHS